jgi:hypothetical protein
MACRSGCPTPGRHESWGACARSARLQIAGAEAYETNHQISREQDEYRKARESGIQPEGCNIAHVRHAQRISDIVGEPYRADNRIADTEKAIKFEQATLKVAKAVA